MSKVLKIFKPLLATIAPTLASAFGGPIAGMAVNEISRIVLGKDAGSESEVIDYILANQSPEVFAKLKSLDAKFAVQMRELEIDLESLDVKREEIAVDDRKSARFMQMETKSWATGLIAALVLFVFGAMIIALFRHAIPPESAPVIFMLTGALSTGVTQVLNFYFGSSKGSKSKDDMIAAAMSHSQQYAIAAPIVPVSVSALPPAKVNPANG